MDPWAHFPVARDAAREFGLDPLLVLAIALTESGGNPFAMRYEPTFFRRYVLPLALKDPTEARARATSWGLMQIMGQVARERGFAGRYLSELCDPRTGARLGAKHLRALLDKHGDERRAVAAYNAGSPRFRNGVLVNQDYVDKVDAWRRRLATEWEAGGPALTSGTDAG